MKLERDLYLASRAAGDVHALERGGVRGYARRRLRRAERRTLLGWLRKVGL